VVFQFETVGHPFSVFCLCIDLESTYEIIQEYGIIEFFLVVEVDLLNKANTFVVGVIAQLRTQCEILGKVLLKVD
jgi:hypothetical protein